MLEADTFFKKNYFWDHLDMHSSLKYYRYASLLIISIFYLLGPAYTPLYFKISVVLFLSIEAWVFIRVFKDAKSGLLKKALILIDMAVLLIILYYTGGLDSVYLWYAINPILISSTMTSLYFCWVSAIALITSAFYLHRYTALSDAGAAVIWSDKVYVVLIFILITLSAQLFNHLIVRLSWQKNEMEKQVGHIKSLYEATEVFSHLSDPQEIANLFSSYCKVLTVATKTIVWVREQGNKSKLNKVVYAVKGPRKILHEQSWYPYIKNLFEDEDNGWRTVYKTFPSGNNNNLGMLITVRIRSSTNLFGVLAAYYVNPSEVNRKDTERTLIFLADLCAASLEKRYLEAMAEKLILAEEKDRIARQIHDTVNQNLFGLIHGLNIINKQEQLPAKVSDQLMLLQKTAHSCLRELRYSIYNLTNNKLGRKSFEDDLKTFLYDLQQLNRITGSLRCDGDIEKIDMQVRNSLFRIIREASSNSIRHGACRRISIVLEVAKNGLILIVTDDGCGFNEHELLGYKTKGLGLLSMKELARGLGGELKIDSKPGKGTTVICQAGLSTYKPEPEYEEVTLT